MKRKRTWFLSLAVGGFALSTVILSADLYIRYGVPVKTELEGRRYLYLAPNKEEKFSRDIALGIRNADREGGSNTLLIQCEDRMEECLKEAVLTEADGVIMWGNSSMEETIRETVEAGIPVIFVNSDGDESGRTCYIGIDHYKAGEQAAERLAQKTGKKGNVLAIIRSSGSYNQSERLRGFEEKLREYPQMQVVDVMEDNGSLLELKEKLFFSLQSHPEIDAIVSMEGVASENIGGILELGEEETRPAIVVFDFTETTVEYLEDGIYDGVIMQDPYAIGQIAVEKLNEYYEMGHALEEVIYIDTVCVTRENIEDDWKNYGWESLEWNCY